MGDRMKEAQELMMQANKRKTSSGGLFGFLKNPTEKYEDAAEMYRGAANKFKLMKAWKEAGDAYREAYECHVKAQVTHEASTDLVDAANVYKKVDNKLALEVMELAVTLYVDMGRLAIAAKHTTGAAELCEQQGELARAKDLYSQAAQYFESEDSGSSANKAKLKVAHLSAQLENYEEAAELFEEAALGMVDNHLLKFNAKEYFLKAGLCRLAAGDVVAAKDAAERFTSSHPAFADTREQKFLSSIVEAVEEGDVDKFTAHVQRYDEITKLDAWMTAVLLKTKRGIDSNDLL
eukprot:m.320043 g.320043  ORF g.320043 m.320043 type:complete len:292 (+) comp23705_c0_seq1:130-1005(+)